MQGNLEAAQEMDTAYIQRLDLWAAQTHRSEANLPNADAVFTIFGLSSGGFM